MKTTTCLTILTALSCALPLVAQRGGGGGTAPQVLLATVGGPAGKLVKMAADGSSQQILTSFDVFAPSWTTPTFPGGQRILFTSSVQGAGVYRLDADGSNLTKLAALFSAPWRKPVASPVVTPTGSFEIVVEELASSNVPPALYAMKADGSGLHPLAASATVGYSSPSWLPSGHALIALRGFDIVRLDLGVGLANELVVVAETALSLPTNLAGADKTGTLDVSPNGILVVFQALVGSTRNLWVTPIANPAAAWQVTNNANNNRNPEFDPTSTYVYYQAQPKVNNLYRTRVDGSGTPTALTNAKNWTSAFHWPSLAH